MRDLQQFDRDLAEAECSDAIDLDLKVELTVGVSSCARCHRSLYQESGSTRPMAIGKAMKPSAGAN
jgi:hypothetical protein